MDITNPNVVEDQHKTGLFNKIYHYFYDRTPYFGSLNIYPHNYKYKPKTEGFSALNFTSGQYILMLILIFIILFIAI